ncbi:RNA polymerase sigma factor [Tsukamurella soli]|uniref:RNA polymerase sigma factor n=1 Tax=Tsukamurella soli TaxID=644556 RepID=A0ABP8JUM7_9ACTN
MVPGPPDRPARAAVDEAEAVARRSYGRLLALLAAPSGDLAGAEDALADAFERALRTWPSSGVPRNPEAWLLTVARNRRRDRWRSAAERTSTPLDADVHAAVWHDVDPDAVEDRRLALLLACTHPAVNPAMHTPLMLSVVLGYTAEQIGRAFAVPTSTMAARLGRAKKRVAAPDAAGARPGLVIPEHDELPALIAPVLEAVYGAFTIEFTTVTRARHALLLGLADTVAEVADTAEAHGLAALLYLSSARFPARIADDGTFVPLPQQDPSEWDRVLLDHGRARLRTAHDAAAAGRGGLGRFQLEAAISAVHCARDESGVTDWATLRELHDVLARLAPTLGGTVARAAVVAETDGAAAGLALVDTLGDRVARLQPAWALRAELLRRLGRTVDSDAALGRAIDLTTDPAERAYLQHRRDGHSSEGRSREGH